MVSEEASVFRYFAWTCGGPRLWRESGLVYPLSYSPVAML